MNRRKAMSRILKYTGTLAGLRAFSDNRILRILVYHRIFSAGDDFPYYLDGVAPSAFEAQMHLLSKHFSALSLEEAVERIESGKTLPKNTVCITIDDGYRDCYDNVYPILKKYSLPATIYIPTHYVDSLNAFWVDKVGYVFKRGRVEAPAYAHHLIGQIDISTPEKREMSLETAVQRLKTVAEDDKNAIIDDMKSFFRVTDHQLDTDYNLSWGQIREMSNNGIRFGAHTVTHPILTRIPIEKAEHEIRESKERIEVEIGKPVYGFCYPNGMEADYSDSIIGILKRYGFKYAVTCAWGFNDVNSDLFRLKRISPNTDDDISEFDYIVSGGWEVARRIKKVLKLHGLTPVESFSSLRRSENLAEAEFLSLSIPTLTGGEFREGGLKGKR